MQCAFCEADATVKIEGTPMCTNAIRALFAKRRAALRERRQCFRAIIKGMLGLWLICLTGTATAGEFLTTRALPTNFLIAPPIYTGALDAPILSDGPLPRWHIAQWGTRDPFTTDRLERRSDGWRLWSAEASLTLGAAPDGRKELLFEQASIMPAACHEIDLFIEPNIPFVYPLARPGLRSDHRSLAHMQRLIVTFAQEIVSAWSGSQCAINVSAAVIGLVFVNLTTTPPQAFFYQVATYESRGALFEGEWFYTGWHDGGFLNFGAVDSPEHFGYRGLQPGAGMSAYDLNLLERVRELTVTNQHGMDSDTSHWLFRGFYLGTAIGGETRISSRIGKVRIYSE